MSASKRRENLRLLSNKKLKAQRVNAISRMIEHKRRKDEMTEKEWKQRKKNIRTQIRLIDSVLKERGIYAKAVGNWHDSKE